MLVIEDDKLVEAFLKDNKVEPFPSSGAKFILVQNILNVILYFDQKVDGGYVMYSFPINDSKAMDFLIENWQAQGQRTGGNLWKKAVNELQIIRIRGRYHFDQQN